MATINLIPPKVKKEQYIKKISSIVFSSLFVALLILVITFVALYGINYYLETALTESEEDLSEAIAKVTSLKTIEEDVNEINAKIKKINGLKDDNLDWNILIDDFNASIPDQVRCDVVNVDLDSALISISGIAESRREIVKLQEKLNASNYFENLGFSTSSYSNSYNAYSFNMSGEITKP